MGMFDTIFISLDKLQLSEKERKNLGKDHPFQTKDFECTLTEIYITDEGDLKINRWEYESVPREERPHPNEEGLLGMIGSIRRKGERLEKIEHHGYVNFYTILENWHNENDWLEFNAKFTNGKLVSIERLTPMEI
jgi:hypothetical protein